MAILCKIFGHKPPVYAPNPGGEYMTMELRGIDGINRQHAILRGECPRCKTRYIVGSTHVPGKHNRRER